MNNSSDPLLHIQSGSLRSEEQVLNNVIYVIIASLSATIWDGLSHILLDLGMLMTRQFEIAIMIYFLSRLSIFTYLLTTTIILTSGMVMNCAAANILIAVMFVMVIATSNYLLFLRLKAIYHDKAMVIRFYFLLWLVYVGVAAIQGASKSFMSIGDQCIPSPSFSTAFAIPSAIAALIYPMSVFGAIAYRLYRGALHSLDDQAGVRMQVEMLVMGHHLPTFSKIIFLDGQMYLVAATAIAVIEIIVLLTPSIPAAYHLVVVPPHLSVLSSMAAYLFRHAYSTRRAHSTMSSAVLSPAAHRFNNGHGSPQGLRQQGIVVSIEVNTDMERSPTPVHLWNDASQGTEMEIQRKDQKFDTDVSQTDTV